MTYVQGVLLLMQDVEFSLKIPDPPFVGEIWIRSCMLMFDQIFRDVHFLLRLIVSIQIWVDKVSEVTIRWELHSKEL